MCNSVPRNCVENLKYPIFSQKSQKKGLYFGTKNTKNKFMIIKSYKALKYL